MGARRAHREREAHREGTEGEKWAHREGTEGTERERGIRRGREAYGEGERHTERERQEVGAKMSKNATELSLPLFFHA